ncbi:MAG: 4-(cytidine 5'-diphospho)-2-C-methyl-D-erythritol kinase, partial [Roseobacter sp.]|jgi:4-diphosphocytidyl-2-C-methyl-D-erythritol kinase
MAQKLLGLGADIPMCLLSQTARISGIGEDIQPLDGLPPLHAVLVNPRRAVSTPAVFRALHQTDNAAMPDVLPGFAGTHDLILWLATQRNDLETAATSLEPAIAVAKGELLASNGCLLARMSGSGATCFGLYETAEAAQKAAAALSERHEGWWVRATVLGTQTKRALPRVS